MVSMVISNGNDYSLNFGLKIEKEFKGLVEWLKW
jgi:hypothetical protein